MVVLQKHYYKFRIQIRYNTALLNTLVLNGSSGLSRCSMSILFAHLQFCTTVWSFFLKLSKVVVGDILQEVFVVNILFTLDIHPLKLPSKQGQSAVSRIS